MNNKVLMISYYWPPAGGPGSMRVVKFAKYLPLYGWQPVILTVEKGEYPYLDPHLADDLSKDIPVYRSKAWDPFSLYKKLLGKSTTETIPVGVLIQQGKNWKERLAGFIRSNFFVPDARVGWLPYAKSAISRLVTREKIDLVFISSPPNSSQLLCRWIKKKHRLPVVCDFRDPWTDIRYYEHSARSWLTRSLDRYFEKKTLEYMDAGITVSSDLVEMFSKKSKTNISGKFQIIHNGYDESDFENCVAKKMDTFEILHTGNMQEHQNPLPLILALKKIKALRPSIYAKIHLRFVGRIHPAVEQSILTHEIIEIVTTESFIAHRDIPPLLFNAGILLMVVPKIKKNRGIVTGKLFEYLGSGRPVLIIGPDDGDAAKITEKIDHCTIFDYEAAENLYQHLLKEIEKWESGGLPTRTRQTTVQFSRRLLSKKLADIFNLIMAD